MRILARTHQEVAGTHTLTTIIKFIIPMALIQLEMLMVTLHKISCLLASAQRELSTCLFFPPVRKNPLFFTQINLLMRLKFFLDILSFPLKWKKKKKQR